MRRERVLVAILLLSIWIGVPEKPHAQQASDVRVADLVQSGKLRAGIGVVAPHWAEKDQTSGELRGVAVEVARALASRVGVSLVPVEYPSPPKVLDGVKENAWDVGFLGIDPSRATVVDFSSPYLEIDATYLVTESSKIQSIADTDQPGIRIAVTGKSVEEIVLKDAIKKAELQAVETIPAGLDLLRAGKVDVLAAPRPALVQFSARLPGSRVVDDRFHVAFAGIAVPKGQSARLSYLNEFVQDAVATGLIQHAIERVGVRGVQVAGRAK